MNDDVIEIEIIDSEECWLCGWDLLETNRYDYYDMDICEDCYNELMSENI